MYFFKKITLFLILLSININISSAISHNEKKMRDLAAELRCMVCQNQSLLESDSELAKDLKSLILNMYEEGKSKKEIKTFLVERYGQFVLFKPMLNKVNLILWLAPIFSLLLVGMFAVRYLRVIKKDND